MPINENDQISYYKNAILKGFEANAKNQKFIKNINLIISDILSSFKIAADCFSGNDNFIIITDSFNEEKNELNFNINFGAFSIDFKTEAFFEDDEYSINSFINLSFPVPQLNKTFFSDPTDPDKEITFETFFINAINKVSASPFFVEQLLKQRSQLNESDRAYFPSLSTDNLFYVSIFNTCKDLPAINKIKIIWNETLIAFDKIFAEYFYDGHLYSRFIYNNNIDDGDKSNHFLYSKNKKYDFMSAIEELPDLLKSTETKSDHEIQTHLIHCISGFIKEEIIHIIECIDEDKYNEAIKIDSDDIYFKLIYNNVKNFLNKNQSDILEFVKLIGQAINSTYSVKTIINNDIENRTISLTLNNTELFNVEIGIDNGSFIHKNGGRDFFYSNQNEFIEASKDWLSSHRLNMLITKAK